MRLWRFRALTRDLVALTTVLSAARHYNVTMASRSFHIVYDFDTLVAGHLTYLAARSDVETSKAYTMDVYTTVKRIHDGTDQMAVMSQAAARYSWDNKFALFRTLLDGVVDQCASEVQGRWIEKLAAVEVFTASHCRAALIYARWDD
jgi:hypothetical protein